MGGVNRLINSHQGCSSPKLLKGCLVSCLFPKKHLSFLRLYCVRTHIWSKGHLQTESTMLWRQQEVLDLSTAVLMPTMTHGPGHTPSMNLFSTFLKASSIVCAGHFNRASRHKRLSRNDFVSTKLLPRGGWHSCIQFEQRSPTLHPRHPPGRRMLVSLILNCRRRGKKIHIVRLPFTYCRSCL